MKDKTLNQELKHQLEVHQRYRLAQDRTESLIQWIAIGIIVVIFQLLALLFSLRIAFLITLVFTFFITWMKFKKKGGER